MELGEHEDWLLSMVPLIHQLTTPLAKLNQTLSIGIFLHTPDTSPITKEVQTSY